MRRATSRHITAQWRGIPRDKWLMGVRVTRAWRSGRISETSYWNILNHAGIAHLALHFQRVYSWRSALYSVDTTLCARNRIEFMRLVILGARLESDQIH